HEEVCADKRVKPGAFALFAEHARDLNLPVDLRHVAILTALLVSVIAVDPLRVRYLFGKGANHFTARAQGRGDECVAGGAQFGFADMLAFLGAITLGGRPHDGDLAFLNLEWAVLRSIAVRAGTVDHEAAVETFT